MSEYRSGLTAEAATFTFAGSNPVSLSYGDSMEVFAFVWAIFSLFAVPYTLWHGFLWILDQVRRRQYRNEMRKQGYYF